MEFVNSVMTEAGSGQVWVHYKTDDPVTEEEICDAAVETAFGEDCKVVTYSLKSTQAKDDWRHTFTIVWDCTDSNGSGLGELFQVMDDRKFRAK